MLNMGEECKIKIIKFDKIAGIIENKE